MRDKRWQDRQSACLFLPIPELLHIVGRVTREPQVAESVPRVWGDISRSGASAGEGHWLVATSWLVSAGIPAHVCGGFIPPV